MPVLFLAYTLWSLFELAIGFGYASHLLTVLEIVY